MSRSRRGLLLAAIQVALVLSLGAKLLYDRKTRPRVWVLGQVYDPDLPIRGRYLNERLQMRAEGFTYKQPQQKYEQAWYLNQQWAHLEIQDGQLVAKPEGIGPAGWVSLRKNSDGSLSAVSQEPVLIFVPETADVPTLKPGEEMWVEVTVPKQGPPRPIRVGIKRSGLLTPLKFE